MHLPPRTAAAALLGLLLLGLAGATHGAGLHEPFESAEVSWRVAETDCHPMRLTAHQRLFDLAHTGRGCEHLQVTAGQGTHIYLTHAIQPARIIPESVPSLWVRSNRHGLQLMARVVFPRTLENGRPITSFLYGDRYDTNETWRQLRITDLYTKLQRETVALRTQKGPQLDDREAYIDMLVLNVYTGPGPTSVWIDDLEVNVFAPAEGHPAAAQETGSPVEVDPSRGPAMATAAGPAAAGSAAAGSAATMVKLQGDVLLVDDRPVFVRAVEHQGETLSFLQSLGFNTVRLPAAPTATQCREAQRCGIWLIAPPPIATAGGEENLVLSDRVLAWHAGDPLPGTEPQAVHERIQSMRSYAPATRPFISQAIRGSSRWRDESILFLLDRPVLHTSFDLQEYPSWLSTTARRIRTATPYWAAIPTEADRSLQTQLDTFAPGTRLELEDEQMRWMAFAAVGAGAKALWFRSGTRLDGQDAPSLRRVAALRALLRELDFVAPWVAGGTAQTETDTANPHVRLFTLRTEKARLLILLRRTAEQQFVMGGGSATVGPIVLPYPPATDQCYRLTPAGVELVPSQRGTGLRLDMDSSETVSLVLLTSDPLAVNYAGRVVATNRQDLTLARRESLSLMFDETTAVERQLEARGLTDSRNPILLADANNQMRRVADLQSKGDYVHALRACDASKRLLQQIRRSRWEQVVQAFTSPTSSPLCVSYATLPAHFDLRDRLSAAVWGVDLLAGGEMEHLSHLLDSGWKQERPELSGVSSDVQLSLEAPHGGRSSLHLRSWSSEGYVPLDGDSPIVITAAPIQVQAGQLVRIRGWVKVPRPLESSQDGLMISDSQTGPSLAERITETQGWQEVTCYRVATATGSWQLRFELTGLGEAWIDDFSVVAVSVPPARQAARAAPHE